MSDKRTYWMKRDDELIGRIKVLETALAETRDWWMKTPLSAIRCEAVEQIDVALSGHQSLPLRGEP